MRPDLQRLSGAAGWAGQSVAGAVVRRGDGPVATQATKKPLGEWLDGDANLESGGQCVQNVFDE